MRKQFIAYVEAQDANGIVDYLKIKENDFDFDFGFTKNLVDGDFSISNFDDKKHCLKTICNRTGFDAKYDHEYERFITFNSITGEYSNDAFVYGGWIFIEQIV